MATLQATIVLLFSILFSTVKPTPLVTRLHHRDAIFPNPNKTKYNQAMRLINTSMARFVEITQKLSIDAKSKEPPLALDTITRLFYVNFSIGEPPIPQLAAMDTGSDVIWVNCNTKCMYCAKPVFDPHKSSSFLRIRCYNRFCRGCTEYGECKFDYKYMRGPRPLGVFGSEKLTFKTNDDGIESVSGMVFGCSFSDTSGTLYEKSTGVFGLGVGRFPEFSILERLGGRDGHIEFSYCTGNVNDPTYQYSVLVLGKGAVKEGDSMSFVIDHGSYSVNLEGISVGTKRLPIDPGVFKRTFKMASGVIIDSGTPITYLASIAYKQLYAEIESLGEGVLRKVRFRRHPEFELCYAGDMNKELQGFPDLTLHFAGGVDMVVDVLGMFYDAGPGFCLAFGPSDANGEMYKDYSIIGMMAQQQYNVAYDLVKGRMYLQRIDCQNIVDIL